VKREASRHLGREDPHEVGGYAILSRLGAGGMGVVYLAQAPDGRLVAVKVVHPHLAHSEMFRDRFRSEVARARQVPSFCTAEVLDADPDHVPPYLVAEYVDGPSLHEAVRQHGPMSPSNVHAVALGVASALTAIHGAEVIHRDLKPRNVLLAPGSPKVIDFGIARALESTERHTSTGHLVGTLEYMSPERLDDNARLPLIPAADIFAWGAVVAYAATGRTPFDGGSMMATAARILTQPPDMHGIPPSLHSLVAASLEKRPQDRPTARELMLELTESAPKRTTAGQLDAASSVADSRHQPRAASSSPPPRLPGGALHRKAERSHRPAATFTGAVVVCTLVLSALAAAGKAPWQTEAVNVGQSTPERAAASEAARNVKNPSGSLPGFPDRYQVVNRLTGDCLAVAMSPPPAFSSTARAEKCSGSPRQVWQFYADHTVRAEGGACIATGARAAGGTVPLRMIPCDGSTPTVWFVFGGRPGTDADVPGLNKRHLFNRDADQCLGIPAGNDAAIVQCKDGSLQEWDFKVT
jgi:serine/threonine protein kinase